MEDGNFFFSEGEKEVGGRMGRGQIALLQAYLRSADRVEIVPMATTGRLDLRSGCPCVCVSMWRDCVGVRCRYVTIE